MIKNLVGSLQVLKYKILGGKTSPMILNGAACLKCKKLRNWQGCYDCKIVSCPLTNFTF